MLPKEGVAGSHILGHRLQGRETKSEVVAAEPGQLRKSASRTGGRLRRPRYLPAGAELRSAQI